MGLFQRIFGLSKNVGKETRSIQNLFSDIDNSPLDEKYIFEIRQKFIPLISAALSYTKMIQTHLDAESIHLNEQQSFEVFILLTNFVLDVAAKDESFPFTNATYSIWLFELKNTWFKEFNQEMGTDQSLNFYNKRFIDLKHMMKLLHSDSANSTYVSKYFYRLIFKNEYGLSGDFGNAFIETQLDIRNNDKSFKESENVQIASKFSKIFFQDLMTCEEHISR